jgi:hypothetical protein
MREIIHTGYGYDLRRTPDGLNFEVLDEMHDQPTAPKENPVKNTYKVVFRNSTVVDERTVQAKTMVGAARRATKMTLPGGDFEGWSVYSITLT